MTGSESTIPFVKASACGNDFLIVDGKYADADIAEISVRMCNRHNGVGADGVEWLFPASDADVCARLINADGSEAEISGNGTRCVAAYLCSIKSKEKVVIRTGAGLKACALVSEKHPRYEFEIDMGTPKVGGELRVELSAGKVSGIQVSMGNPHYVMFVDRFSEDWREQGAEIQRHSEFKQGINVEFVKVTDQSNIEVRFFERGVGETQSSGTGSCAAAVATISTRRGKSPLKVHAQGGEQSVRWEEQVFLRGPAQIICRGEFLL